MSQPSSPVQMWKDSLVLVEYLTNDSGLLAFEDQFFGPESVGSHGTRAELSNYMLPRAEQLTKTSIIPRTKDNTLAYISFAKRFTKEGLAPTPEVFKVLASKRLVKIFMWDRHTYNLMAEWTTMTNKKALNEVAQIHLAYDNNTYLISSIRARDGLMGPANLIFVKTAAYPNGIFKNMNPPNVVTPRRPFGSTTTLRPMVSIHQTGSVSANSLPSTSRPLSSSISTYASVTKDGIPGKSDLAEAYQQKKRSAHPAHPPTTGKNINTLDRYLQHNNVLGSPKKMRPSSPNAPIDQSDYPIDAVENTPPSSEHVSTVSISSTAVSSDKLFMKQADGTKQLRSLGNRTRAIFKDTTAAIWFPDGETFTQDPPANLAIHYSLIHAARLDGSCYACGRTLPAKFDTAASGTLLITVHTVVCQGCSVRRCYNNSPRLLTIGLAQCYKLDKSEDGLCVRQYGNCDYCRAVRVTMARRMTNVEAVLMEGKNYTVPAAECALVKTVWVAAVMRPMDFSNWSIDRQSLWVETEFVKKILRLTQRAYLRNNAVLLMNDSLAAFVANTPKAREFLVEFRQRLDSLDHPAQPGQVIVVNTYDASRYRLTVALSKEQLLFAHVLFARDKQLDSLQASQLPSWLTIEHSKGARMSMNGPDYVNHIIKKAIRLARVAINEQRVLLIHDDLQHLAGSYVLVEKWAGIPMLIIPPMLGKRSRPLNPTYANYILKRCCQAADRLTAVNAGGKDNAGVIVRALLEAIEICFDPPSIALAWRTVGLTDNAGNFVRQ